MIFEEPATPKVVKKKVINKPVVSKPVVVKQPVVKKEVVVPQPEPISDKKREVMEAIRYLKSKNTKTKADREKIQMLEVILKTV